MTKTLRQLMNVSQIGEGARTVVLAHGIGTDQTAWYDLAERLAPRFRVVLFDWIGCGRSDLSAYDPLRYGTLHAFADDLLSLLDELGVEQADYVGHSLSGIVGCLAAAVEPERFGRLVLLGASPRYLDDGDYAGGFTQEGLDGLYAAMGADFQAWVAGFAPLAMQNPDRPHLAHGFARTLGAMRPDIALGMLRTAFQSDARDALPRIASPTLVLQARDDIAVPQAVGRYLARHIRNGEYREIDAAGHFAHIAAPDIVAAAVVGFLG
ncbi:MAG TPA: alpha/beta hydrolase [Alphaproteobacteria bacterium]|nr:alpha/beta hydrolase [Alphaproteobacteria bacterium]